MTDNRIQRIWQKTLDFSGNTPATRNRFVDLLRIFSIMAVVVGHWLLVTGVYKESGFWGTDVLSVRPDTHWLTWILQVMPVFFFVGGYANGVSWRSHLSKDNMFQDWYISRIRRLVWPTFPLILVWFLIVILAQQFNFMPDLFNVGAQIALQPVWFLVVYIVIVLFTPLVLWVWKKMGIWSFWILSALAVCVDVLRYGYGLSEFSWANYVFVWLAVHQLGIAWQDGWFDKYFRRTAFALGGFGMLVCLVTFGPYQFSMVNIPGDSFGNLFPPSIVMLALAGFQGGTLLLLENRINTWLQREKPWALVVLLNQMTMTIYLWHVTVNALVIGAAYLMGGVGLKMEIGSLIWWLAKFIWIPVLFIVLIVFVLIFSRFERPEIWRKKASVSTTGIIIRIVLACVGLGVVALEGISGDGLFGLNNWALVLIILNFILLNRSLSKRHL